MFRRGGAAYIERAASGAEVDPVAVAVRVVGDAAALAPRVAALARQVDAGLHLRDIVTLDDIVVQEQTRMVGVSVVFGSVLLVALVFSAAGLYALMAVAVARRTRGNRYPYRTRRRFRQPRSMLAALRDIE